LLLLPHGWAVTGVMYVTAGSALSHPPQLCLCPSLTPHSTPQPVQEVSSPWTPWKDPPLRSALALSTCPARRARSKHRRAPRMMQMMTGTETLPLLIRRPRVGSA